MSTDIAVGYPTDPHDKRRVAVLLNHLNLTTSQFLEYLYEQGFIEEKTTWVTTVPTATIMKAVDWMEQGS
ncbi:hypothetical protein [Cerasicoccus frondis]|uniref:hypothetical protein n=1 Tax=Cerasicoccus frondis TaxID=490090 RepID=UPI002852A7FF|nr:hypothetical protein [Cerasicoccus frondis]